MKKIKLLSLFLLSSILASAQSKDFNLWLNMGVGSRLLDTEPGIITTSYIDDSPSRDTFESMVTVKDQYKRLGLHFEIGYAHPFNLSHSLIVDFAVRKPNLWLFGYSLGFNQKFRVGNDSKIIVRPSIAAMLGAINFNLGKIQNNSSYIQIGNEQYFDDELNVALLQDIFVYGPQLGLFYIFPNEIGVSCNIAYDFNYERGQPQLSFSSSNTSNNSETAPNDGNSRVNLDDSNNVIIDYSGNQIKKLPYKYGGFRLSFAFSLYGEY